MDRREAISIVSLVVGGAVIGAGDFLSGCTSRRRKSIFGILDNKQVKVLEELAETILPKTKDSPGAKDVGIGRFFNTYVSDCYNGSEQKIFLDGIMQLEEVSRTKFDNDFIDLKKEEQAKLLMLHEDEAMKYNEIDQPEKQLHYYVMMKQVAILGYLTSEIVGTKVFRHVPIPGRFEGCIPYKQGEKAFI